MGADPRIYHLLNIICITQIIVIIVIFHQYSNPQHSTYYDGQEPNTSWTTTVWRTAISKIVVEHPVVVKDGIATLNVLTGRPKRLRPVIHHRDCQQTPSIPYSIFYMLII